MMILNLKCEHCGGSIMKDHEDGAKCLSCGRVPGYYPVKLPPKERNLKGKSNPRHMGAYLK